MNRKNIIIISILFLLVFIFGGYSFLCDKNKVVLDDSSDLISIFVEGSNGVYTEANSFPGSGYVLNRSLSKCENGGVLSGNGTSVTLTGNKSDKCYLYFTTPWVNTNSNKSVTCNNSSKTWDYKINGFTFSPTTDLNCTVTKSANSTSQTFAQYIASLAGTTQGNGLLVHEFTSNQYPYSTSTYSKIAQAKYNMTTPFRYNYLVANVTSGTDEAAAITWDSTNNAWKPTPSVRSTYYYYLFNVTEAGYYQLCYRYISGGDQNNMYLYKNTTSMFPNIYINSTEEACYDYGYVKTTDTIKVIEYTFSTNTVFNMYLKKTSNIAQKDTGYRYEGEDPNNYIWFNNELWRIIGVFGSDRHGVSNNPRTINNVSDTYLIKIIRDQSIGGYAWNGVSGFPNKWPDSTLYRMLNGCYYYAKTGTDTIDISGSSVACSNYCIGYYSDDYVLTSDCDFSYIGIQNNGEEFSYRDMVQEATWYLGGPGKEEYQSYYPEDILIYETTDSAVYGSNPISATGYVGLMYFSDYGYSIPSSSCSRSSYNMISVDNIECSNYSWLFGQGDEWTITPRSNDLDKVNNNADVYFVSNQAKYTSVVRPVLYLKSNIYKLGGTGTINNPYVVGIM